VALLAVAAVAAVLLRDDPAPVVVPPNSVAVVDPGTNRVVDVVPLGNGKRPGPIAFGAGAIWVGNRDDQTVTRIDAERRTVVTTIGLNDLTPTGLTVGFGFVWVAHGRLGELSRIDTQFNELTPSTIDVAGTAFGSPNGSVARDSRSIWAVFGDATLARITPAGRVADKTRAGSTPAGIAVGHGFVWVTNSLGASVWQYHPATFTEGPIEQFNVGRQPIGIAAGAGAIWVANSGGKTVMRIDPNSRDVEPIDVAENPTAVVADDDSVWVASTATNTLSRIDPETREVVRTIDLGNAPSGLVLADGFLWVTVQAP
jgi:YVTN family beta-propeller protein